MKLFAVLALAVVVAAESQLHCTGECLENPSPRMAFEMMQHKQKAWDDCMTVFGNEECVFHGAAIEGAIQPCINGISAGEYPCNNIDLLAFIPHRDLTGTTASRGNDMWGWTDPITGAEIAIVCQTDGTTFIDVSDPINPAVLGRLNTNNVGQQVSWRDAKVFNDHVFIISEGNNHGMQVFDLRTLRGLTDQRPARLLPAAAQYNEFGSCHNIALDEGRGIAFGIGSRTCNGGPHQVNVTVPTNPQFAGCFSNDGYTHDSECVIYRGPDARFTGREICFHYNEDTLTIVDHTDTFNAQQLSRTPYANSAYTHQGWLDESQGFLLLDDELDEQRGNTPGGRAANYIWNVQSLTAPRLINTYYAPERSIDHNQYTRGQYTYQSNYESGLRIVDISNIAAGLLNEVAHFDVRPESNNLNFNGMWSSYNYFESGVVVSNSIERGFFVFAIDLPNVPRPNV